MSKVIELSDEQYRAIERAAATRGQTADALLAEWIEELRERARPPRYYDTDDWFRHLGMSDAVIAQVKEEVRREAESDADAWGVCAVSARVLSVDTGGAEAVRQGRRQNGE